MLYKVHYPVFFTQFIKYIIHYTLYTILSALYSEKRHFIK